MISSTTTNSALVYVSNKELCNVCRGRGENEQKTIYGIIDVIKCKACQGTGFIVRKKFL